jgi:hypothetical protein
MTNHQLRRRSIAAMCREGKSKGNDNARTIQNKNKNEQTKKLPNKQTN